MARLTYEQIYSLLRQEGADHESAKNLAAISMAESGGNTDAGNDTSIESSFGLFQINTDVHNLTPDQAKDPRTAARYAIQLYSSQGLRPWSVTHEENGRPYLQYLREPQPASLPRTGGDPTPTPTPTPGPGQNPLDPHGTNNEWWRTHYTDTNGTPTATPTPSPQGVIEWPKLEDYAGDYGTWMAVIGDIASTMAMAGRPLPPGAPPMAGYIYDAAKNDIASQNAGQGLDPTQQRLYGLQADQIAQTLATNQILLPYDIEKIKLDIRSGELGNQYTEATMPYEIEKARIAAEQAKQDLLLSAPIGSEAIMRTDAGQAGFRDYWANRTPNKDRLGDADYQAGFKLAESSDQPRQDAISTYMDNVIKDIGNQIEARGQDITAAVEQTRTNLQSFRDASSAFEGIQKYTIPTGSKYVPGFEEGGLATSLGLQAQKATPVHYDPFTMSLDILRNSPNAVTVANQNRPSGLGGFQDPDIFKRALDFYRGMA